MLPLQAPSPYSLLSYDSHTLLPFGVLRVFEFQPKNDIPFLLNQKSLGSGDLEPHRESA